MFRVAAIDDNPVFLERYRRITESFFRKQNILYEIKTYKYAAFVLEDIKNDLFFDVFLIDIKMPEMSGMELAYQIRQMYDLPYIIFVTSYVKYSIKGYEYNAWRYIVKNEMDEKLPQAYESLIKRLRQKKEKLYIIDHPRKMLKIPYEEIYYIHKDGKNTVFVTRNCLWNDKVSLEQVIKTLNDPMFVRCERGNIVNIHHIMSMEGNELIMRNGEKVPVSGRLVKTVRKSIADYWRNQR